MRDEMPVCSYMNNNENIQADAQVGFYMRRRGTLLLQSPMQYMNNKTVQGDAMGPNMRCLIHIYIHHTNNTYMYLQEMRDGHRERERKKEKEKKKEKERGPGGGRGERG